MPEIDRISPCQRPASRAAGYHIWSDLVFIHWRVPEELLRPLVPKEIAIDTFDGSAWVGLVPFRMSGVRPWWSPPVWGLSSFPETNVRTYVHYEGTGPGVWFFSLDAANWLAVQLARRGWGLNYHWAKMSVDRRDSQIRYNSRRVSGETVCEVEVDVGEPFSEGLEWEQTRVARPGTLEHFLIERYLLYASRSGKIYRGQVHHRPYPLHNVKLNRLNQRLLSANGIELHGEPCHVAYSPEVRVEVFGLQPICRTQ